VGGPRGLIGAVRPGVSLARQPDTDFIRPVIGAGSHTKRRRRQILFRQFLGDGASQGAERTLDEPREQRRTCHARAGGCSWWGSLWRVTLFSVELVVSHERRDDCLAGVLHSHDHVACWRCDAPHDLDGP